MKKIVAVSIFMLLLFSLTGCKLTEMFDNSEYTVSGTVRGVVNGGKVVLGDVESVFGFDGVYSVTVKKGSYDLTVYDNANNELYTETVTVEDNMVKDITVDSIRLTYWRPVEDINETKAFIDQLAEYGVTDLYVETFFHGMTIYPSQYATQKSYAADYFEQLIDYAHSKGIRVHAWVETLYWYNLQWIGDPPAGHILDGTDEVVVNNTTYTINLSLVTTDKDGNVVSEGGKVFASPFNPQVVELITNIVAEIDTNYDVDGISLDYIRFPASESAFGYGQSSPYEEGMTEEEMHTLRVAAIRDLVKAVGDAISEDTVLSASVFPGYYTDGGAEYNKSQDWQGWIGQTGIDWMLPMCYDYALDSVSADLELVLNAQKDTVTIIPVLAINSGHEPIDAQYEIYSAYDFAGYGVWKADFISTVLP